MLPLDCQQDPWLTRRKVSGRPLPAPEQVTSISLASLAAVRGQAGGAVCASRFRRGPTDLICAQSSFATGSTRLSAFGRIRLAGPVVHFAAGGAGERCEDRIRRRRQCGSAAVHAVLDGDIDRQGHFLVSDDVF
jgi:hypothetical protein